MDLEMTEHLVSFYGEIMGFVDEGKGMDFFSLIFLQNFKHFFPTTSSLKNG